MGAETSVVVALLFLGFLIVAATVYSSVDYYKDIVKSAQYDQDTLKKAKIQTDITITNITNGALRLNITLKNTGKTTLNASAMNVFVSGKLYNYSLLSAGKIWTSESNMNLTISPVTYDAGDRIKITTENGISDYALVP